MEDEDDGGIGVDCEAAHGVDEVADLSWIVDISAVDHVSVIENDKFWVLVLCKGRELFEKWGCDQPQSFRTGASEHGIFAGLIDQVQAAVDQVLKLHVEMLDDMGEPAMECV